MRRWRFRPRAAAVEGSVRGVGGVELAVVATADGADLLANYRFSSSMVGLPVHMGMFMRMCEKVYRLKSIYEKGGDVKVADESVADTLRDIGIIAILMRLEAKGGRYSNASTVSGS